MEKTVTYEVPSHKGSTPILARYGEFDGNALLRTVLAGDGPGITDFLVGFLAEHDRQYDAANARYDLVARIIKTAEDDLIPKVTLTGFKSHKNTDPKTRYRRPLVTNEGEGCQVSCDLAAKYRLPDPPESLTWANETLVCQKHAIKNLSSQATELAGGNDGQFRRIYLTGDQSSQINDTIREGLKGVTK